MHSIDKLFNAIGWSGNGVPTISITTQQQKFAQIQR